MIRAVLPAVVLFVALLAGCVQDATPDSVDSVLEEVARDNSPRTADRQASQPTAGSSQPPVDPPRPSPRMDAPAPAPVHLGSVTLAKWTVTGGACSGCPVIEFTLPDAAPMDGWLDVRVLWDGTLTAGFGVALQAPDGSVLAGERGFDATRIKLPQAPAGSYRLAVHGEGDFALRMTVLAASSPKVDLDERLPNLVNMVPVQVGFAPCQDVEQREQGAQRCLRLGNAVGNVGDGPVEVHLGYVDAVMAVAGGAAGGFIEGQFVQRVYGRSGSHTDEAVGPAFLHLSHAHWHYDGFARFHLYPVDDATGLRGPEAAAGHKAGFCFLDWGAMDEQETSHEAGGRAAQECLVPTFPGWSMGISAGYFDFYWAGLADQYIEVSGVADGVYELVATADPDSWLRETDTTDNQASVVVRITGDQVQVLEERGWYRIPDGTSQL